MSYQPFVEAFDHALASLPDAAVRVVVGAGADELSRLLPRLSTPRSAVPWRARSSLGDWSIAPLLVGLANWPAGFHSVSPLQCPFAYVVGAFAGQVIVTPRMHGIHHSTVRNETDSNWSSWFTVWDWLHGTLNLGVSQQAITIGVPAYRDATEVRFGKI